MPGDEFLSVAGVDFLAGFEVEDDLVFGAVVFENTADVFGPGQEEEETDEEPSRITPSTALNRNWFLSTGHQCERMSVSLRGTSL